MVEWSGKWMAFTLDHKDAKAIERFREVHGREPESVIRDENARLLLVGPIKGPTPNLSLKGEEKEKRRSGGVK